jgi:hypothetical protein
MSQSPSLRDGCVALCQCSIGKAETEKDKPEIRLRCYVGMSSDLVGKRPVGDAIKKRKARFQVRSG